MDTVVQKLKKKDFLIKKNLFWNNEWSMINKSLYMCIYIGIYLFIFLCIIYIYVCIC